MSKIVVAVWRGSDANFILFIIPKSNNRRCVFERGKHQSEYFIGNPNANLYLMRARQHEEIESGNYSARVAWETKKGEAHHVRIPRGAMDGIQ